MTTSEIDRELHAQVMKREEVREKAFREERMKYEEEFYENLGMGGSEMSKKELRKIIDSDRRMYYRTEDLNDKLYIHYKGWRDMQNLEGWTGLKTLYAECNAFSEIASLQNCRQLRSLFLQDNAIKQISGLESCELLWSLNLSGNFIERIEGLRNCTGLNTLIISKNKIGFGGIADVDELVNTSLCSLDIQDNKLDDPDVLPEVFARMKDLRVLYLKGNPCAKKIVNYRKSLTVYCKDMRYIDDRPVFEDDRRGAEAFNRGGIEEERAEKKRIREEKTEKHDRNMRAFSEMVSDAKLAKREKDAMRAEDKYTDETDPVESFERRAKRLQKQWEDDNKDDIKDDAKEYAEKCLEAERSRAESGEGAKPSDEQKATTETREAATASGDTGGAISPKEVDNRKLEYEDIWDEAGHSASSVSEKKKDDRKLVYDDIWDDSDGRGLPTKASGRADIEGIMRAAEEAAKAVTEKERSAAGAPTAFHPPGSDVFMPWADGAIGMDAVQPSKEALDKRKAAKADDADTGFKPSWHSKYKEQLAKGMAQHAAATASPSIFAPPARTAEALAADTKPEASAAEGAGELDEMD